MAVKPDNTLSLDEQLRRLYISLENQRKALTRLKRNTTAYNNALKVFNTTQNNITELETKIDAGRKTKKTSTEKNKLDALNDALTRAKEYGTADQVEKAQNDLDKFSGVETTTPTGTTELRYGPGGESLRPGSAEYIAAAGSTTKPIVTSTKTPASTTKPISTPTDDATTDAKQLWVSYLRTVFSTLEDKTQQAEINRIFDTAVKQKWTEQTFMENLKGTSWWQNTSPSLIQFFLESNDPRNRATFAETVANKVDSVAAKLEKLGIAPRTVDPITGKVIDNAQYFKGIALQAYENNWTDSQLDNYLSTKSDLIFTGGGVLGSSLNQINQTAYLYGINLDSTMKNTINTSLLDPMDGRDAQYWINSVKQMAIDAPQNKPFYESLKVGKSLYEVTSNYRNQMAGLLEVDPTAITWNDLMGKVIVKDTGNARTFADFNKALKQDPIWQYTKNAKETYSNMALDLGRTFGYVG